MAAGPPADVVDEALVQRVFGLPTRIISDPVSGTPLVIHIGAAHRVPASSTTVEESARSQWCDIGSTSAASGECLWDQASAGCQYEGEQEAGSGDQHDRWARRDVDVVGHVQPHYG
ncbi:hypothetical protein BH23ACT9_BH23ACT9_37620 [soil metagenome]